MGWIALATRAGGQFRPGGLGSAAPVAPMPPPGTVLPRGTLMIETRPTREPRHQATLLEFARTCPREGRLALRLLAAGEVALVDDAGTEPAADLPRVRLPVRSDDADAGLRITYGWDVPARWGRLTLERPGALGLSSVRMAAPHPIALADLHRAFSDPRRRRMDGQVIFAALSDRIEPVGPMPGLAGHVPVRVPGGHVPVARLRRGDRVIGAGGAPVPVLQAVAHTVPALGSLAPVRLRAPWFGLRDDLVMAAHQRLVIPGPDVEYLFGCEAVLVPVGHLVNGISALPEPSAPVVRYHGLVLPEHDAIEAAGVPVETLHLGRMRRSPGAVALTLLKGIAPAELPEHAGAGWPVLRRDEAIALAMGRGD
ncbi:MAG: Hint domain-containing protein [Roseovarius sp.]|nr:Hint domain-containing protein [Roseovarius sp.]